MQLQAARREKFSRGELSLNLHQTFPVTQQFFRLLQLHNHS